MPLHSHGGHYPHPSTTTGYCSCTPAPNRCHHYPPDAFCGTWTDAGQAPGRTMGPPDGDRTAVHHNATTPLQHRPLPCPLPTCIVTVTLPVLVLFTTRTATRWTCHLLATCATLPTPLPSAACLHHTCCCARDTATCRRIAPYLFF